MRHEKLIGGRAPEDPKLYLNFQDKNKQGTQEQTFQSTSSVASRINYYYRLSWY